MPKFTLTAEHMDLQGNPTGDKITVEFNKEYLPEVLEQMELFLRGVGFSHTGVLDFIDEDTMVATTQAGVDALAAFYGYTRSSEEFTGDGHDGMGSTAEDYPELNKHSEHYFDTERNK